MISEKIRHVVRLCCFLWLALTATWSGTRTLRDLSEGYKSHVFFIDSDRVGHLGEVQSQRILDDLRQTYSSIAGVGLIRIENRMMLSILDQESELTIREKLLGRDSESDSVNARFFRHLSAEIQLGPDQMKGFWWHLLPSQRSLFSAFTRDAALAQFEAEMLRVFQRSLDLNFFTSSEFSLKNRTKLSLRFQEEQARLFGVSREAFQEAVKSALMPRPALVRVEEQRVVSTGWSAQSPTESLEKLLEKPLLSSAGTKVNLASVALVDFRHSVLQEDLWRKFETSVLPDFQRAATEAWFLHWGRSEVLLVALTLLGLTLVSAVLRQIETWKGLFLCLVFPTCALLFSVVFPLAEESRRGLEVFSFFGVYWVFLRIRNFVFDKSWLSKTLLHGLLIPIATTAALTVAVYWVGGKAPIRGDGSESSWINPSFEKNGRFRFDLSDSLIKDHLSRRPESIGFSASPDLMVEMLFSSPEKGNTPFNGTIVRAGLFSDLRTRPATQERGKSFQIEFLALLSFLMLLVGILIVPSAFQKFQILVTLLVQFLLSLCFLRMGAQWLNLGLERDSAEIFCLSLVCFQVCFDVFLSLKDRILFYQKLGSDVHGAFGKGMRKYSLVMSILFVSCGIIWPLFLAREASYNLWGLALLYLTGTVLLVWLSLRIGLAAEENWTFVRLRADVFRLQSRIRQIGEPDS